MASNTENTGSKGRTSTKPSASKEKELKTEGPLSEKDEVKQAEQKTNKGAVKKR